MFFNDIPVIRTNDPLPVRRNHQTTELLPYSQVLDEPEALQLFARASLWIAMLKVPHREFGGKFPLAGLASISSGAVGTRFLTTSADSVMLRFVPIGGTCGPAMLLIRGFVLPFAHDNMHYEDNQAAVQKIRARLR